MVCSLIILPVPHVHMLVRLILTPLKRWYFSLLWPMQSQKKWSLSPPYWVRGIISLKAGAFFHLFILVCYFIIALASSYVIQVYVCGTQPDFSQSITFFHNIFSSVPNSCIKLYALFNDYLLLSGVAFLSQTIKLNCFESSTVLSKPGLLTMKTIYCTQKNNIILYIMLLHSLPLWNS